MIPVSDADAFIAQLPRRQRTVRLPLLLCRGQRLAEDIKAERDQPPFHRVAMDGIAVCAADCEGADVVDGRLHVERVGVQAAGHVQLRLDDLRGQRQTTLPPSIEVMTGAPLPVGCDVVLPYEKVELVDDGTAHFAADESMNTLRNVHPQAADYRRDDVVLDAGALLSSPRLALMAAQGCSTALVQGALHVAIISTGDELVGPDVPLAPHQIRSSNDVAMQAMLDAAGFDVRQTTRHHLRDDEAHVRETLATLLDDNDVLLLSGGVSKGKFDYVPQALRDLGVVEKFHRVQQKPGKPLWVGEGPQGQLVFALPGNPVSTMVSMRRYVVPKLLDCCALPAWPSSTVRMTTGDSKETTLTRFVQVNVDAEGNATPVSHNGSGDFSAAARADGFVEIPASQAPYPDGAAFAFFAWERSGRLLDEAHHGGNA